MATVNVDDQVKYLGPWDPCGSYGWHPYQGKVGRVIDVLTVPPLPERPITIRFKDGTVEKATSLEVVPA
ncbi:MAG: hypothetical protein NTZ05_02115 [Chloroflexi bacterium]|nr:hypothetical protein [Chloroflexota bacterium]